MKTLEDHRAAMLAEYIKGTKLILEVIKPMAVHKDPTIKPHIDMLLAAADVCLQSVT